MVGGRVVVSVMVDCEMDDVSTEDDRVEDVSFEKLETKLDVETDLEVDDFCNVNVPITVVMFPCTMHTRLELDSQGLGEADDDTDIGGDDEE